MDGPTRVARLITASSSVLTRDQDAVARLGVGMRASADEQIWTDPALTEVEKVRAAAIAAADVDVCSADARADYLNRVHEIRFTADAAPPVGFTQPGDPQGIRLRQHGAEHETRR
jgi:hypothetical protein